MRQLLAPNRMALPLRNRALHGTRALDVRRDARRSPATTMRRGKVVLTAIALAAAVALVAVASWPLTLLVVLAFVRGLFAADIIAFRNAARRGSSEQAGLRGICRSGRSLTKRQAAPTAAIAWRAGDTTIEDK